jgi:hypothetical protein
MMMERSTSSLLHILLWGVNFEFACSHTVDECVSQLEDALAKSPRKRKDKQPAFISIHEHIYNFSFERLITNRTVIAFNGRLEGQPDYRTYVTGHTKVALPTWIWMIYPAILAVVLLNFFPPLSALATIFVIAALYFSARDCRKAPEVLFELLNCDKARKTKKKRNVGS